MSPHVPEGNQFPGQTTGPLAVLDLPRHGRRGSVCSHTKPRIGDTVADTSTASTVGIAARLLGIHDWSGLHSAGALGSDIAP